MARMINKKIISFFVILLILIGSLISAQVKAALENSYSNVTLTKIYDGTGHGTSNGTFINSDNGFTPGDNGPNDGYVTSQDFVGYKLTAQFDAGPARSIELTIDVPEYLEFDPVLNQQLCVSGGGATGTLDPNSDVPTCHYQISAGQPAALETILVLTAKDTAGTIKANQITSASIGLQGKAPSTIAKAQAVSVISVPAADLVVRPAECTVAGKCQAMNVSVK